MTISSADDLPLVSVIAINYNNSKYVIETLDSIAAQTYPNIELIIVDDCSTDDSVSKIEQWLSTYTKPFRIIRSPKNEGVSATCNKGYREAKGKYVAYIATDDAMLPEKITKQAAFFETLPEDTAMIYGDAYLINEESNKLFANFIQRSRIFNEIPSGEIFEALIQGNFIPAMSAMIKPTILEKLGGFDESLFYEDYDMWLRVAKNYKIIFQDEILVKYRIRKGSMTHNPNLERWLTTEIEILSKHDDNEIVRKRMEELIIKSYFSNYRYKELVRKYKVKNTGFTYKCMRLGIPSNITKAILAFAKAM